MIREALEAKGLPVVVEVRDGRLMYQVHGQWLTPGEAAATLDVEWP